MVSKIQRLSDIVRQDGLGEALKLVAGYTRASLARWPFLKYYHWRSGDGIIKMQIEGSQMYLDLNDPGISTELILRRKRETIPTNIFQEKLSGGDSHIDVGANIGYYALQACRAVGPSGRVIAVEPMPRNVEWLRRNRDLNRYKNTEVVQKGIADTVGTSELATTNKSNLGTMTDVRSHGLSESVETRIRESDTVEVETTTVDQLVQERSMESVDSIRMDIEGAELNVVEGMEDTISEFSPCIHMEIHLGHYDNPESQYRPMFEYLDELGCEPHTLVMWGERHNFDTTENFLDFLFDNPMGFPHVVFNPN